mgnify:CR=1 FL=1
MNASTVGLDIGKRYFQIHAVDEVGTVVQRKTVTRGRLLQQFRKMEPALVGIEACATGHYWARQLKAMGHDARLIPPTYVKPYVRRQKSDAADAAAICEAVSRPSMRFVPIKSADQQAFRSLTRVRERLKSQKTATVNAVRGHLAEFGLVNKEGKDGLARLKACMQQADENALPATAKEALQPLIAIIEELDAKIAALNKKIEREHRANEVSRRLETIPGIGPITASTFRGAIPDPGFFKSGREFAAFIGLVPKQHSTGGKTRLGRISKQGDQRLRSLLVCDAASILRSLERDPEKMKRNQWIAQLLATKPRKKVIVAIANKMARNIWAVMTKGVTYQPASGFLSA